MICNERFGVTFGRFSGAVDCCANPSFNREATAFGRCLPVLSNVEAAGKSFLSILLLRLLLRNEK